MKQTFEHFDYILSKAKTNAKTLDLARLYQSILHGTITTRRDYAMKNKLRSTSVSTMVAMLIKRGLILESSETPSRRGRPTMTLHINYNAFSVAVIRITSQTLICNVVNIKGDIIAEASHRLSRDCTNSQMLNQMIALFHQVNKALDSEVKITRLVCSIPGILDLESGYWLMSSRWANIRNLNITEGLTCLGLPITVARNLDCELIARTDVESPSNSLLIHWGYGVGSAYNQGMTPVNLSTGRFGEIGHWDLALWNPNADPYTPCRCGKSGCVEVKCALWSLWPVLTEKWPDIARDEDVFQAAEYPLLEHPAIEEAVKIMVSVVGNLYRTLFPSTILLSGPFFDNAAIYQAFTDAFKAKGGFSTLPPVETIYVSDSPQMELIGASTPLISQEILARLIIES